MYNHEEVKNDILFFPEQFNALELKYGEDFFALCLTGVKNEDTIQNVSFLQGDLDTIITSLSNLIKSNPRFTEALFKALASVLSDKKDPEVVKECKDSLLSNLGTLVFAAHIDYKQEQIKAKAEDIVNNYLNNFYNEGI